MSPIVLIIAAVLFGQRTIPPALQGVGIDQRVGNVLPLDVRVTDEHSVEKSLSQLLNDRPSILVLVYYTCPGLCNLELNGLQRLVRSLPLQLGEEYQILSLSIDPTETPTLADAKKQNYTARMRDSAVRGWKFLTANQESISQIAQSVGFRYKYDDASKQYSHAAGIIVLTPQGRISRYFPGVEYEPRELKRALVEASSGSIGTISDKLFLFCFHYDPATAKYSLVISRVVQMAGILTVFSLIALIWSLSRRTRSSVALTPGAIT